MFQEFFGKRVRGIGLIELLLFLSVLSFILISIGLLASSRSDDTVLIESDSDVGSVDVLSSSPSEGSSGANFVYGQ